MIFTDRIIAVQKGTSSINDTIVLYRGDKDVEIRFTLNEGSPFRFGSGASPNIIEKTEATYGQLVIKTPGTLPPIFSEVTPTIGGKITFTITAEMIDEITEVGNYTFQIRLLDENMDSRATLPEVKNGIEIREPIASEDGTNEVGVATVGYALTTVAANEDAFDAEGNYNKTTWGTGDRITAAKLNKMEAGIDEVNKKIASNASDISIADTGNYFTSTNVEGALQEAGSQIKDIEDSKADKDEIFSMANMGQDIKEAMTGGSVAVVGKNTVLETNIVDGQVTPRKTSFCKAGTNKFNIDNVKFGIFADPRSGSLVEKENVNYYTMEFEVLPQTQYLHAALNTAKDVYIKTTGGFICFLDSGRNLLNYISSYDTEYLETPENCYYVVHSIYSSLNYETLLDRQPMFVLKSVFGTISNMFGNYIPFEYILDQDVIKVENNIKIVNNLTSPDINNPLSANMGKELNEKINSIAINSNSPWSGKIGITYGDSITAINNPESPTDLWGTMGKYNSWGYYVKTYLGLEKLYGRGIGGQTYSWRTNGGSVAFVNSDGSLHSRDDNYNYDNYNGDIPTSTTKVRGAFCSWSRITAMIPESIKDTIDFIFVMGGANDIPGAGAELGNREFVKDNTTDTEWANSSYYNGGDFDVSTYIGGMCSTIMKLQAWCPNAVIIVGTSPNGRAASNPDVNENKWIKNSKNLYYIDYITKQETVLKDFGIPCIDIYGKAGINPFNRKTYIADWVHPYSDEGCKALARVIIGDMKTIIPKL